MPKHNTYRIDQDAKDKGGIQSLHGGEVVNAKWQVAENHLFPNSRCNARTPSSNLDRDADSFRSRRCWENERYGDTVALAHPTETIHDSRVHSVRRGWGSGRSTGVQVAVLNTNISRHSEGIIRKRKKEIHEGTGWHSIRTDAERSVDVLRIRATVSTHRKEN